MKLKSVFLATLLACVFLSAGSTNAQYAEKWSCHINDDRYLFMIDFKTELLDFNQDSCADIIWPYCSYNADLYNRQDKEDKSLDTCFDYIWDGTSSHILWATSPGWGFDDFGNTDDDPYPEVLSCNDNCGFGDCRQFKILDGRTGETEWLYNSPIKEFPMLIDIDHDGIDEILFIEGNYIRCFEYVGRKATMEGTSHKKITLEEFEAKQIKTLNYEVYERTRVLITIRDMWGQTIDVLADEEQLPGKYSAVWDIRTFNPERTFGYTKPDLNLPWGKDGLATGEYSFNVRFGDYELSIEMFLLQFRRKG